MVQQKDTTAPPVKKPEQPIVERRERAAGLAVFFTDESVVTGFAFFYDENSEPESLIESPEGFVPSGKCVRGRHTFSLNGSVENWEPDQVGPSVNFTVGAETIPAAHGYYVGAPNAYGFRASVVDRSGTFGLSFGPFGVGTPFKATFSSMPEPALLDTAALAEAGEKEDPIQDLNLRWTPTEGDFVLITFIAPQQNDFDRPDLGSEALVTCIARNTGSFAPDASRTYAIDHKIFVAAGVFSKWEKLETRNYNTW